MVRLKAAVTTFFEFKEVLFQFQNGAIKRAIFVRYQDSIAKFQFQNGAIKSLDLQKQAKAGAKF
jgi:hypothetical protein